MGSRAGNGFEQRHRVDEDSPAMTFVHLFAHDVRHVLHAATSAALLLERQDATLDQETAAALRRTMLASLHELERILENVLDLDHIDQVDRASGPPFRLDELARDVVATTAPPGERFPVDAEPVLAPGSEVLVRRALVNLVRNAIVHAPIGTQVTIRVCREPSAVGLTRARVEVEDDGPGISPRDREQVFEVFHRVGESTGRPGLGLGLPLVRRIARLHDGDAWIEAAPSGGVRAVMRIAAECPGTRHLDPATPADQ